MVIEDIFLKLTFKILKNGLHNNLPYLPKRMKIEKIEKLIANFSQPLANFIHIRNFFKKKSQINIEKSAYSH